MKGLVGVALGLACASIVACGAARPMATAQPSSVQFPDNATDLHAQITELEQAITAERGKLGFVDLPAGTAQPMAAGATPPSSKDATCTHADSETCTDVCTLSDAICGNAGKICDLAGKLGDDAWAKGKCRDATASCTEANKKCCSCL